MLCNVLRKPSDNASLEEEKPFTFLSSAPILVQFRFTAQDRTECLLWKGLGGSARDAVRFPVGESATIPQYGSIVAGNLLLLEQEDLI